MHIIFISPCDLSIENGGWTHTVELARNLNTSENQVVLVGHGFSLNELGFRYINIPFNNKGYLSKALFSFSALLIMYAYHFKHRFDVLFIRMSAFDFPIIGAKILRIPTIAELNDIPYSESFILEIGGEKKKLRKYLLHLARFILYPLEKLNFRLSNKIIATTQKIKSIKQYPFIKDKVRFVSFGANTELFRPLSKLDCRATIGLSDTDKVICFVGSFHAWHGLEDLIKGMSTVVDGVPEARLLLVGDDDYPGNKDGIREKLEQQVRLLKLEKEVKFVGRVPYDKVVIYINSADVCISALREVRGGFSPLKLFEYLACGKPVVGTDVAGVSEVIREAKAGILVAPEKPQELANGILKLLNNEELGIQMGKNGLHYVENEYSWKGTARLVEQTFHEVLPGN